MRRWLKWLGGTEPVQFWYEYLTLGLIGGVLGAVATLVTILLLVQLPIRFCNPRDSISSRRSSQSIWSWMPEP